MSTNPTPEINHDTPSVGQRVVAILKADYQEIVIFGHGTYIGERTPEVSERVMNKELYQRNPEECIQLDKGGYVYRHECGWLSEEEFDKGIHDRTVKEVDVRELRRKSLEKNLFFAGDDDDE